jgi:hypothetical protein
MMVGYKTYIVAALLAALSIARYLGLINKETADALEALLIGGGLAALRAGINSR